MGNANIHKRKATPASFKPGCAGGPGRPRGVPNRTTIEVREASRALVEDPAYRRKLAEDLRKRKVAPMIEQMLWHYAYGKPKHLLEIRGAPPGVLVIEEQLGGEDEDAESGAVH